LVPVALRQHFIIGRWKKKRCSLAQPRSFACSSEITLAPNANERARARLPGGMRSIPWVGTREVDDGDDVGGEEAGERLAAEVVQQQLLVDGNVEKRMLKVLSHDCILVQMQKWSSRHPL
jgi:hypothetical protein